MTTNGKNGPQHGGKIVSEFSSFRGRGSLQEVVTELRRQVEARADFVIDTRDMRFEARIVGDEADSPWQMRLVPNTDSARDMIPREGYGILPQALTQIAGKNTPKMPARFAREASEVTPNRLADFLTGCMHDDSKRRLVRALDGDVRAFLSDSYRVVDNLWIAEKALGVARDCNARVLEASLTDSHMRLKFVAPEIWNELEVVRTSGDSSRWYAGGIGSQAYLSKVSAKSMGDLPDLDDQGGAGTVWPIGGLGNSETGHGRTFFDGGILLAVCFNIARVEERLAEIHLGGKLETGIFRADTVHAEAETIQLKLRDCMHAFFTPAEFAKIVDQVRATTEKKILAPSMATKLLVKKDDRLADQDLDALLSHFTGGTQPGGQTVFNLGQTVSRMAQDRPVEKAAELEALAGEIVKGNLNKVLEPAFVAAE